MSDRKRIIAGLFWRLFERFGAQGVTFVVSLILARLLDPSVYGVVAIVTVFSTILQVFVDSGLGNSLIQKKEVDDLDYSSVFYFNIAFSITLYILIFLAAPLIAFFYKNDSLTLLIRVSSCSLLISGVKNVQQAYISRNMMFKKFFFATIFGTIGAACIGILMAFLGFGVWAIIAQNLFNLVVDTFILWISVKWRPKLMFSFKRLGTLLKYGWKLLAASLVETIYTDFSQLMIGKKYSTSDLAFYNRGKHFPSFINTNVNSSIKTVMFPVLSKEQDNISSLKEKTRKTMSISAFLIMPALAGLAAVASNMIEVLLTDKWLFCVPFLQIFCAAFLFQPLQTANKSAIKALGKSGVYLIIEIIVRIFGILAIFVSMSISVTAVAFSVLITSLIEQFILIIPNSIYLKYGAYEQFRDIFPNFFQSLIMFFCVFALNNVVMNKICLLIIQVFVGIVIYLIMSIVFRNKSFYYIVEIIRSVLSKKRKS